MNFSNTSSLNATVSPAFANDSVNYKIGIGIALMGNFIIAVSLNVQKCAHRKRIVNKHVQASQLQEHTLCAPDSYLRSGTWWIGFILMVVGEVGNFVAYGFAPASVVAPLGCVAVIANAVFAVLFNNESLRMRDIFGASFAIIGSFLIIQFSEKTDEILDANALWIHLGNWQFILYITVELILFVMILFIRSQNNISKQFVLFHLLLVAILGSFTVICAKGVSGMLAITIAGDTQLAYAMFYVMLLLMLITTVAQLRYLNQAMTLFDVSVVVPVNFAFFTINAILAGAVFYEEFFHQSQIDIFMFLFGCCLSFLGVIFITGRPSDSSEVEEGALHLDMMPNFIRSFAVSLQVQKIQPTRNLSQATCYPDEEVPILQSRRSSCRSRQSSESQVSADRTIYTAKRASGEEDVKHGEENDAFSLPRSDLDDSDD